MPRHLLVVTNTDIPEGVLRALVYSRAGADAETLVVAPASEISRLNWLTNAEDNARSEAHSLAVNTAVAVPTEDVEARGGNSDPLKAIADALRTFAADEILIVGHPDDEAGWLESGSGVAAQDAAVRPTDHPRHGRPRRIARQITQWHGARRLASQDGSRSGG